MADVGCFAGAGRAFEHNHPGGPAPEGGQQAGIPRREVRTVVERELPVAGRLPALKRNGDGLNATAFLDQLEGRLLGLGGCEEFAAQAFGHVARRGRIGGENLEVVAADGHEAARTKFQQNLGPGRGTIVFFGTGVQDALAEAPVDPFKIQAHGQGAFVPGTTRHAGGTGLVDPLVQFPRKLRGRLLGTGEILPRTGGGFPTGSQFHGNH